MKTDLSRILSINGKGGLYRYVSQGKGGVIVEALADGHRTIIPMSSRITALSDVSIYTEDEEMKLQDVFVEMGKALDGAKGPSHKGTEAEVKAVFDKAIPTYDGSRFYISHMRKALEWYNALVEFASLDFEVAEDETNA